MSIGIYAMMNNNKYEILFTMTLISFAFCIVLPLHAALGYMRCLSEDYAYYMPYDELSYIMEEDDMGMVLFLTLPSLFVIFITFFHYIWVALFKPDIHVPKILPIFVFKTRFMQQIGKILSHVCIYTMPVLIPLGICYVYNTKAEDGVYNVISYAWIYLLPMLLMMGAGLFFVFYIAYFIKLIVQYVNRSSSEKEEWFIY